MIKAMFFDLDGTLLNSEKRVPASAMRALEDCKRQGIRLFIATGRSPRLREMLGWTEEQEDFFDGGVYCNGACIKTAEGIVYTRIPPEVVTRAVACVNACPGLNIALQMTDGSHAFNHPLSEAVYDPWGIDASGVRPVCQAHGEKTVKMLVYFENLVDSVTPIPGNVIRDMRRICEGGARLYVTDGGKVLQIVHRDASKYEGVEKVRRMLGIGRDEVAVFGDDMNDLEMLRGYEYAVAMGNACDEIKTQVKRVTKSNDEDGIAHAIREILRTC